jgi:hypothetical protein
MPNLSSDVIDGYAALDLKRKASSYINKKREQEFGHELQHPLECDTKWTTCLPNERNSILLLFAAWEKYLLGIHTETQLILQLRRLVSTGSVEKQDNVQVKL